MRGRRDVLRGLGATGTLGLLGGRPGLAEAEPPPETRRLRTTASKVGICVMDWHFLDQLKKELKG